MTKSNNCIGEMQARLIAIAEREQRLIDTLNEALRAADRKLLDDVRSLSLDHEARRSVILTELQGLADRLGALPAEEVTYPMIEDETIDAPYYAADDQALPDDADDGPETEMYDDTASVGGDWRKAAEKIRDGFDFQIYRRAS